MNAPILTLVPALPLPARREELLLRPVVLVIEASISVPYRVMLECRRPPVKHAKRKKIQSHDLLAWVPTPPHPVAPYAPRKVRPGARPKSMGAALPLSDIERETLLRDEKHLRSLGVLQARPRVLGECIDEPGPCGWVSCRAHLYLEVNEDTGAIKLNFPDKEPDELAETCAFRVARRGGLSLEEVGKLTNLMGERVSQIEDSGRGKLREALTMRPRDERWDEDSSEGGSDA